MLCCMMLWYDVILTIKLAITQQKVHMVCEGCEIFWSELLLFSIDWEWTAANNNLY